MFKLDYRLIFFLVVAACLAACQPAGSPPAQPAPATAASPVAPAPTAQEATMTPPTNPGGPQQAALDLAVAQLAKETGLDPARITVVEVKAVIWRDASLGCPKPGIDYIQVETPGFNIQLKAGEQVYSYHANETGRVIRCER